MTLGELTKVFCNDTLVVIKLYNDSRIGVGGQLLYSGKLYGYSNYLNEQWPDNNFKNFNVINVNVVDNHLDILIEE